MLSVVVLITFSLPPIDDISSWSAPRLKGVSGRFAQRWRMDRAAGLLSKLLANRSPQPVSEPSRTWSSSRAGSSA